MKTIKALREAIRNEPARSAWDKGKRAYALELIEEMDETVEFYSSPADKKNLLNGAGSWDEYSQGGCSLIYDTDIAERLCSPSELKRCNGGEWNPSRSDTWLDTQARALSQAAHMIVRLAKD